MKKIFITLLIIFSFLNLYAAPLQFSTAPDISSYLSDDFQNNIMPYLKLVSDVYYKKAAKKYNLIYPKNEFTVYQNKLDDKGSINIAKEYLTPDASRSMQVFLIENQGDLSYVEVFFIVTTGKISRAYSIIGYVNSNNFTISPKTFSFAPEWIYGTLALIYHDSTEYNDYDIITGSTSERPASLIFIPDNKNYFSNLTNTATYPAVNVINKKNVLTFLISDRRILQYFKKYEVEPQGTFHKYLGGAVTMKACIYAEIFNISNLSDGTKKLEITSIPALFMLESDKGYNRSYAYQKSFYKSLSIKNTTDYMRVLDEPNGNEITVIEKVYYKSRDILYTPWNNKYEGQELWYAVILPKLNKSGYVLSSQADITEKGAR